MSSANKISGARAINNTMPKSQSAQRITNNEATVDKMGQTFGVLRLITSSMVKTFSTNSFLLDDGDEAHKNEGARGSNVMAFLQNRSLSLVDMYIDTSEPTENVGQIQFSLEYNFNEMTLILRIMQAKELPAKDLSGTSDPYVRVALLPDKKHKLETKIKRRTLHPKWHETFYFEGFPIQKLQSRVLHLHVFDYDRFSRDDSIGEVHIPLCQVDFSEKNNTFWKALRPLEKNKCGEILTSIMYQPSNSQLTLTVIKCRNLKAKDINGKSDPYVKVWLYFGEKRIEKKKSEVQYCTLNPEFHFSVVFEVPWERIRECQLNITVMDHDKVGRNEAIGKIMLGKAGSGTSETKHWSDMITKPRQTVVQWHRLKPE